MLEEQKLREWEEKFDREQKICKNKKDQERLKEEKLKQLDLLKTPKKTKRSRLSEFK